MKKVIVAAWSGAHLGKNLLNPFLHQHIRAQVGYRGYEARLQVSGFASFHKKRDKKGVRAM